MEYPVYSIRDSRTGFMAPTLDQNDDAASRNFLFAVKNSRDVMGAYPDEFSLYRLGTFNTESGVFFPEPVPVHVAVGSSAFTAKEVKNA